MKTQTPFPNCQIHESAYVDLPCSIGDGTAVWHYSHIMQDVAIGQSCNIGQNVFIGKGVKVGNRVKIQNNVSVYAGVTLEDDVFCGPSMVFTNIINPRSEFPRNSDEFFKPTLVKQGASIGANATIICGVTIGEYAFIGAGAVVTGDVQPYALVYGNPARQYGWACRCGESLDKAVLTPDIHCSACGRRYQQQADTLYPV